MSSIFRSAAGAALTIALGLPAGLPGVSWAETASQPAEPAVSEAAEDAGVDPAAGAYLAARQASIDSDFAAATGYFSRALMRDPGNARLLESAAVAELSQGALDRAAPLARRLEALGPASQVAQMIVVSDLAANGRFAEILERPVDDRGLGPLVDGLIRGWALMGTGAVAQALAQFDTVAEQKGLRSFAMYHKALALASVGDFESAEALFSDPEAGIGLMSRRAAIAHAQILSQLERNPQALERLAETFGAGFDPGLTQLADRLAQGEQLGFTIVDTPLDGVAEVFFTIGAVLRSEAASEFSLLYARIGTALRPSHVDALLLSAELLDELGQYDLSVATYRQVPVDSPDHHAAELGRAEALRRADKLDAAAEVLERLAKDQPRLPLVHSALGDLRRQQEKYDAAVAAYDRALEFTEEGAPAQWFLLYARGISHERLDHWDTAEADLRHALKLAPEQPQVLNYLGYSLVEKRQKLDEALDMIERAVAARPDSGYIVDSLGWVLFRLGRYDEAVGHMERAVELMAVDPVVNDHLGDVYWAVGRKREAQFQWKRALSFVDPTDTDGEADPDRMRRKLDVGLDQVLSEEGADPLTVADDKK